MHADDDTQIAPPAGPSSDPRTLEKARLLTAIGLNTGTSREEVGRWGIYLDLLANEGFEIRDLEVWQDAHVDGLAVVAWGTLPAVQAITQRPEPAGKPEALLELVSRAQLSHVSNVERIGAFRRVGPEGASYGFVAEGRFSPALVAEAWPWPAPLDLDEVVSIVHTTAGAGAGQTQTAWSLPRGSARRAWVAQLGAPEDEWELAFELLDHADSVHAVESRQGDGTILTQGLRVWPSDPPRSLLRALLLTSMPEDRDPHLAAMQGALDVQAPVALDLLATDDGPRLVVRHSARRGLGQ